MPAEYLVNFGTAQVYFDATGRRCAPPGSGPPGEEQTVHFVQVPGDGTLLAKSWDVGLVEFTAHQRQGAKLYKKCSG